MSNINHEVFINLMTDFGFKRMFGSKKRKHILIRFLNILFEKDGITIDDVDFQDKEILPSGSEGKKIVYDIYCTTPKDKEHIILEMQQIYHDFFENRTVLYAIKALADQPKKGGDYEMSPVYSIFLVDFHFPHMTRRGIHDVGLYDRNTHEPYSNLLRLLFIHLSTAKKNWEDCKTKYDKMLFIIKNMHKMDKKSKPYLSGEFEDMFREAEVSSMAAEDVVAYSESRQKYEDILAGFRYAERTSYAEGRAEGRAEGKAEGKAEGMEIAARRLMEQGMSADFIKSITGLTPADLN